MNYQTWEVIKDAASGFFFFFFGFSWEYTDNLAGHYTLPQRVLKLKPQQREITGCRSPGGFKKARMLFCQLF
jgi:hypothetical protein